MASAQAEVTLVGPGARTDETAVAVPRQSRRRRLEIGLFVLPAVLFQLCWGWYPLVAAFLLSFTNARVRVAVAFTGLDSYLRMWHDPLAIQAFRVTAIYAGADDLADVCRADHRRHPADGDAAARHSLDDAALVHPAQLARQHARLPLHVQHPVRHLSVDGDRHPPFAAAAVSQQLRHRSISGSSFPGCSSSAPG